MTTTKSFVEHINTKATEYNQNRNMMYMMAQQVLIKNGFNHRVLEITDEQITVIDTELERRLGKKIV